MFKLATLATLFLASSALARNGMQRFLQTDTTAIAHAKNLPCFLCIMSDYTFCVEGVEHPHVNDTTQMPNATCCKSSSSDDCPQASMPGWTCSNTYSQKLMSLRMCPFRHDRCGNQSEILFKNAGDSLGQNLTFYPGDVCFFTLRSECGVPSFNPQGADSHNDIDIFTIEYDDSDVEVDVVSGNETGSSVPLPNGSTTAPKFPIPKKQENFDGQKKNLTNTEGYILRYNKNSNGSTTYYYSNNTVWLYEPTTTVSFAPTDTKDRMVKHMNGTNVTYNKDGSILIDKPGQAQVYLPPKQEYDYESAGDNFRRRMLGDSTGGYAGGGGLVTGTPHQSTANTQANGTVLFTAFFFMDGRIKEARPNNAFNWDNSFYNKFANPNKTSNSSYNSTSHLKIRVFTNGSYILYWADGSVEDFLNRTDWNQFYFQKKGDLARQMRRVDVLSNGFTQITFLNNTIRRVYPKTNIYNTTFENATAPSWEEQLDSPPSDTIVRRAYRNGTVGIFTNGVLTNYERPPPGYADPAIRVNYTDGTYSIYFQDSGRKIFYTQPPVPGINTTFEIATAIRSYEYTPNGSLRLVYVNGTITRTDLTTDVTTYEVAPTQLFNPIQNITLSNCSYVVKDTIKETKLTVFCPPPLNATAGQRATAAINEFMYKDGSRRVAYFNGTVAVFMASGDLDFFEVPPKSYYVVTPIVNLPDNSVVIDFTRVNGTKRTFPAPLNSTATPQQRACALRYKDQFANGTERLYFVNGTVAIVVNGIFKGYERPPPYLFGGCVPGQTPDGRRVDNCSAVNGSVITWAFPPEIRNTSFENATALQKVERLPSGASLRYFFNGSIGNYNPNEVFMSWKVSAPTTAAPLPFENVTVTDTTTGERNIAYANGTVITFGSKPDAESTLLFNVTSYYQKVRDPSKNITKYFYRNGSVGLENFNGSFAWQGGPPPLFVNYNIVNQTDGTRQQIFDNGTMITDFPPPPESASDLEKANYMVRNNSFGNGLYQITYLNGTVAQFNKTNFTKYVVPPASIFVNVTIEQFEDGSQVRIFTNNTMIYFGPAPNVHDTPEMKAFAIERIDKIGLNQTIKYRNGTVARFFNNSFVGYIVPPTSYFVTKQVQRFDNGTSVEYYSNRTVRTFKPPPDSRLNTIERSRYVVQEEIDYNTGKGRRTFLNGTVIATYNGTFVAYIVAPTSYFTGCVFTPFPDGSKGMQCANGTERTFPSPLPSNATEEDRAGEIMFVDRHPNGNYTFFYKNGTVTLNDQYRRMISYIRQPQFFFATNTTTKNPNGSVVIQFSNNTLFTQEPPMPANASLFENYTSVDWTRDYRNGTVETRFRNGTLIIARQVNGTIQVAFVRKAEGNVSQNANGTMFIQFTNGSVRAFFPLLPQNATPFDRAVSPKFEDRFPDGSKIVTFLNRTVIKVSPNGQVSYIIPPAFYYSDVNRTDNADGSFTITFANRTIITFYPPVNESATPKQKAAALVSSERRPDGKQRRVYQNGTIALFQNGIFVKYEVAPKEIYRPDEYPTTKNEDGSKTITFPDGRIRTIPAPNGPEATIQDNQTAVREVDCFGNTTCITTYMNKTRVRYDDDFLIWIDASKAFEVARPPPPQEPRDPTYTYVNKTGPKIQPYDKSQSGSKKYKEEYQNNDKRAHKSEPKEPICKGRNQMIIMGDWRVLASFYNSSRLLQSYSTDDPAKVALDMSSNSFIEDTIPTSSEGIMMRAAYVFGAALLLTISLI